MTFHKSKIEILYMKPHVLSPNNRLRSGDGGGDKNI